MKKNDLYKRAEEAFKKLFGDRYDEGRAQECVDKVWDENNPEGSMSRLEAIIGRTEARMKASQNFDALQFVRTQLFDAPADVKASFNDVVNYFDKKELESIDPHYAKDLQETILKVFSHNRQDNSLDWRCEKLGLFKDSKNTPKITFNKDNIEISIGNIKAIIYSYVTHKVGPEGWKVVRHRELNLQINRLPDKDTLDRIYRECRLSLNCELKLKGTRNPKIIISRPKGGDDLRSLVSCAAGLIKWIYGNNLNPELFRFKSNPME